MSDSGRNHSLPQGFYVRKATPNDFQKVRQVSKNAYSGFDDIPAMFNIWLQQKMVFVYILTYFQDVVSSTFFCVREFLILVPNVVITAAFHLLDQQGLMKTGQLSMPREEGASEAKSC